MFKKTAMLMFCLAAGILFTGCFGGTEVNDRAFVQLMGLDNDGGVYSAALQIYRSESGSSEPDTSKANSYTVSGRGATVSAALADAEIKAGKKLFLGHIKMLIIGKGVKYPSDELALFADGSVSPSCPVVFAEDPISAAETLPEEGTFSAERFIDLMSVSYADGKTVFTSIADIVPENDAALPIIFADSEEKTVKFNGLVLVGKEGIAGNITEDHVPGVKLLRNGFEKGDRITVPISVNGRKASAVITDAKTKLKADIIDGKLKVSADMKIKIKTEENSYGIPKETIEKAVRKYVGDCCAAAYSETAQHYRSDVFGIGKLVKKYCPESYGDYNGNSKRYLSESAFTIKITSENSD